MTPVRGIDRSLDCKVGVLLFLKVVQSAGTSPPRTPRGPRCRSSAAPLCLTSFGRGADLASGVRLAFCSLCRFCREREQAPRASRCPPGLVGFLARIWAVRFALGALMKLTANLEAPVQNTNAQQATRSPPVLGGSAKRGGLVPELCTTYNKKPPPGAARSAGGLFPLSARPTTSQTRGPKTAHPTPSLPPSRARSARYRGAADERQRGPRGVRGGALSAKPSQKPHIPNCVRQSS